MIDIVRAAERGHSKIGWLDSRHTFSFGDYYDPERMGFSVLRVINEDKVTPGAGFPAHGHRDMEILSWVLDGQIGHKDSTGTGAVLGPGELQRMTAGTGVTHSEMNASRTAPLHFLQIWIIPERRGLAPGYEQKKIDALEAPGLHVVAARHPPPGALTIHQDVTLFAGRLAVGATASHTPAPGRKAWVQVARGAVELGVHTLAAGDGAALDGEGVVTLEATAADASGRAEVLVFDLP